MSPQSVATVAPGACSVQVSFDRSLNCATEAGFAGCAESTSDWPNTRAAAKQATGGARMDVAPVGESPSCARSPRREHQGGRPQDLQQVPAWPQSDHGLSKP